MSYRLITVLFVRVTCRCFPVHSSNARCISRRRSRTAPGRTRAGSSGERRHGGVRGRWVAQRGTGSLRRRRRDGRGGQQGAAGAAASVPAAPRGRARRAGYRTHSTMYCVPWYTWVLSRFPVRLSRRGLRPRGSYNSAHVHEYQVAARAAQAEGTTTLLRRHVREHFCLCGAALRCALAATCAALSRPLLVAAAPTSLVATLTRRRGHP